ncbi:RHS repeat-associated core domain-containing protein [Acidovorax sp. NCPPB 3576]|uniref:RHS repeat-associated core domain-containing protein n=1 Tax=Acidovorax sp. NCPPB 3576 TaxID=2940488 RepID=UPI00234BB5C1|nr:RHS repeat-associated core domain-containing protein [Acidovorax sp. NCPPB 3576]WCM88927.1 DUF6531 domain-containing protein [Acidovorax sp. NCPPB 3576]
MPKAARLHDPIAHTYAREGHAAGAATAVAIEFGAAVAIGAAVGTIACPGLGTLAGFLIGAAVFVGTLVVSHMFSLVGDFFQSFGEALGRSFSSDCGELTATGSATVFINKLPAIRAGLDVAMCDKHSMPPSLVNFGSENVFIDTFRAGREGDYVDCEAKISKGSEDVNFGGESVPVANFRAQEIPDSDRELAAKARFWAGILGGAAGALKAGIKCFGIAVGMGVVGAKVLGEVMPSFDGGQGAAKGAGNSAGTALGNLLQGKPVHAVTGAKVLLGDDDTDFALSGALPIVWQRTYASTDARTGVLGTGWSLPFSVELVFQDGKAHYIDEQGRDIPFDDLPPGGQMFSVPEGLQLSRSEGGVYYIGMPSVGWVYTFGARQSQAEGERLSLRQWADLNHNAIDYHRDAQGLVRHITDTSGHRLALHYTPDAVAGSGPRLLRIDLTAGGPPGTLVEYRYSTEGDLVQVTDRTGRTVRRFAWAEHAMVAQTFESGLVAHYQWDRPGPQGRVLRHWLDDAGGGLPATSWTFEYDLPGEADGDRRTRVTDHLGRVQLFDHDADQNVTRYEDPLGHIQRMEWNGQWQLRAWTRADGSRYTFDYDRLGNLVHATDPLGQSARIDWHERLQRIRATTAVDGSRWHYEYDERGNCTEVLGPPLAQDAPDASLAPDANPSGTPAAARYREATVYDARGLPVLTTDANGGRQQWRWTPQALLASHTDCSGKTTRFEYDASGHLRVRTDALGQATQYIHDPLGRLLSVQHPDGSVQNYAYDAAGRLASTSDSSQRATRYQYNLHGQLLTLQAPNGRAIHLGYDAAHRLATLVNENHASYEFAYDTADRLLEERRPDGSRHALDYDPAGRVVALVEHPGEDDVRLQGIAGHVPASPIRTLYRRDALGRLQEKQILPSGEGAPGGALLQRFAYDPLHRLVRAQMLDAETQAPVHTLEYAYNALGDVVKEAATDAATGERTELRHAHDALGNRTETGLPDGRTLHHLYYGSGHLHQIHLDGVVVADIERDDLHREVLRTQGRLASRYAYDALGRRSAQWTQSAALRVTGAWAPGRAAGQSAAWAQRLQRPAATDSLLKQWEYDSAGELARARHSRHGETEYRYDPVGRLLSAVHAGLPSALAPSGQGAAGEGAAAVLNEVFHYDPAGNRVADRAQAMDSAGRGWVRNNRVKVLQDKRFDYDGFGRLVRKRIGAHTEQHFRYDAQHRMTQAAVVRAGQNGEPVSQVFRYRYDALGRRIAKADAFGETTFTWEGLRLLQERRGGQCSSYVYEPGSYTPLARIDGQGALEPEHPASALALGDVDTARGKENSVPTTNGEWADAHHAVAGPVGGLARMLAAQQEPERRAADQPVPADPAPAQVESGRARIYYFHTQANGLPEELSDRNGNLVWRAQYRAWGSAVAEEWQAFDTVGRPVGAPVAESWARASQQTAAAPQNLRMQGQYLDRETGLHYNTFRYYDPDLGAFTTPDPIGLAGGLNLHGYAPNPVSWVDPWGWSCTFDSKANRWRDAETGRFTNRPVDPSELVVNGKLNHGDVNKWAAQGGIPDQWQASPQFPSGGFKYKTSSGGVDYSIHGHGSNPNAPAGSNASQGPTASITSRPTGGNFGSQQSTLSTGGKVQSQGRSNSQINESHIPLDGSPY